MTDAHVGMYIRLLCLQHQKGRLSDLDMLYICKTYVEDVYLKFCKDEAGFYYNKRMEDESLKRKRYSESRRINVSHRYQTMKKKASKKEGTSTYVLHMENENEDRNENISEASKKTTLVKKAQSFVVPTLSEVSDYCQLRKNTVDPESFIAYYAARGWKLGAATMKDWKMAVITWEKRQKPVGIPGEAAVFKKKDPNQTCKVCHGKGYLFAQFDGKQHPCKCVQ